MTRKAIMLALMLGLITASRAANLPDKNYECEAVKKKMAAHSDFQMYNILSIDGGGIRGIIPAYQIEQLEKIAFKHAEDQGYTSSPEFQKCFQYDGKEDRMAMKDIFDMVAGTSTGSIIAAGLTYPKDDMDYDKDIDRWVPKFWATDLLDIYLKEGDNIFKPTEGMSTLIQAVIALVFMILFGSIGYCVGTHWYDNPEKQKMFQNIQKMIDHERSLDQLQMSQKDIQFMERNKTVKKMTAFNTLNQIQSKIEMPEFNLKQKLKGAEINSDKLQSFGASIKNIFGFAKDEASKHQQVPDTERATEMQSKDLDQIDIDVKAENEQQITEKNQDDLKKKERQSMNSNLNASRKSESQKNQQITEQKLDEENRATDLQDSFKVKFGGMLQSTFMAKQRDEAQDELDKQRQNYERRRPCKWFITILFMFIGSLMLIMFTRMVTFATNSLYDRSSIEKLMDQLVGKRNISQAISDELMITAYEYNAQTPHLYTKYSAVRNPELFNVPTSLAAGSSSSAPGYFEPQQIMNGYQKNELLIDGGIIANNPALLAYLFAEHQKEKQDIRLLSLGTGLPYPSQYDIDGWNKLEYMKFSIELMVEANAYMTDQVLNSTLQLHAEDIKSSKGFDVMNYHRANCFTDLSMDSTSEDNLNALIETGKELFQNNTVPYTNMIKEIVDEKFAYFKKE